MFSNNSTTNNSVNKTERYESFSEIKRQITFVSCRTDSTVKYAFGGKEKKKHNNDFTANL